MASSNVVDFTRERREVEARYREQLDLRLNEINKLRDENAVLRALRATQAERLIEQGGRLAQLQSRQRLAISLAACGWTIAVASLTDLLLRWIGP